MSEINDQPAFSVDELRILLFNLNEAPESLLIRIGSKILDSACLFRSR